MSQKNKPKSKPIQTEVVPKAKRRQFSPSYKKKILAEVATCTEPGQIGAILRREGLYSSHLANWRKQEQAGELESQSQAKTGRPAQSKLEQENKRLRHENEQLKQRLSHLEAIIDIQKKVSQLLGQSYQPTPQDGQLC